MCICVYDLDACIFMDMYTQMSVCVSVCLCGCVGLWLWLYGCVVVCCVSRGEMPFKEFCVCIRMLCGCVGCVMGRSADSVRFDS